MTQERMRPDAPYAYADYVAAGWTDAQMIAAGHLLPVTSADAVGADEALRLLIERVERLEEEKKGISDDIRDVYSEGKARGYDAKIMRQIVRLRKMGTHDRHEMEAQLECYKAALGLA